MANGTTIQILSDGPLSTVAKFEGVLDTSDLSLMTVLDPAIQYLDPANPATQYRVDALEWSVGNPLSLRLLWDASTDVNMINLTWSGRLPKLGRNYGGLQNNSGAGKTGKILALTTGYSSGTLEFTVIIHAVKQ